MKFLKILFSLGYCPKFELEKNVCSCVEKMSGMHFAVCCVDVMTAKYFWDSLHLSVSSGF
jgi:hypothetical protein